jgi:hypothetical protein
MTEIVGHVVAAERQHGEGIAADLADFLPLRGGRVLAEKAISPGGV